MAFRKDVFDFSGLDACQYISLAQLGYQVFLKTTSSVIELITDKEQFNFIERCIRGGYVFVNDKHADVSDDPEREILYLDLNNMSVFMQLQQNVL